MNHMFSGRFFSPFCQTERNECEAQKCAERQIHVALSFDHREIAPCRAVGYLHTLHHSLTVQCFGITKNIKSAYSHRIDIARKEIKYHDWIA